MRIGLMVGSDSVRQRADRLAGAVEDARAAEEDGFVSLWFPQVPGYLDAMTTVTLMGQGTDRLELGTAVVPIPTRHPVIMAQQALTTQLACQGRFALGLGPSHHWIIDSQLGLPYERPAHLVRNYLEVLNAALAASGSVDVDNEVFRVHSPFDVADPMPMPVLIAALAPIMLRIAGEQTSGTILWMADERAIGDYVAPRIAKAAADAGRPAPRIVAGVPVALCLDSEVDEARQYASNMLGHAELSPNYKRLLEQGDATDVGDVMAAGDEATIIERLQRFRDAGVTDLAARVVPLGSDRASKAESRGRTQAFLATLCPEM
jgi:F420-dependent oxidoreductase-like protein